LVYVLYTLFVIDCVFLILVILLQSGKGGDVAAAFGGAGSQTAFGPRGAQKPLEKATIIAAGLFMFIALLFSLPGVTGPSSVVTDRPAATLPTPSPAATVNAPVARPTAAAPAATATPQASPSTSPAKK